MWFKKKHKSLSWHGRTYTRTHTEEHAHNVRIIVESIFKPFKVATSKRQKFLFRFKPTNCSSNVNDRRNLLSYVKMKSKVDQAPSSHLIKMCLCACPFLVYMLWVHRMGSKAKTPFVHTSETSAKLKPNGTFPRVVLSSCGDEAPGDGDKWPTSRWGSWCGEAP